MIYKHRSVSVRPVSKLGYTAALGTIVGHAVGPRLQRQRGRQVVVSPAPLQLTSRGTTSRQLTASHTWAGRKGVRRVVWGAAVGGL